MNENDDSESSCSKSATSDGPKRAGPGQSLVPTHDHHSILGQLKLRPFLELASIQQPPSDEHIQVDRRVGEGSNSPSRDRTGWTVWDGAGAHRAVQLGWASQLVVSDLQGVGRGG